MSDTDLATFPGDGANPASHIAVDPVASVRTLAAENATQVRRLRCAQIPQHIGMAAACRALAAELPRALMAQIDDDLTSGALAQRWDAVRAAAAEPGASGELDSTVFALALLLREQRRIVIRHLVRRQKEWTADAYRLEGQASALEGIVAQLLRAVGGAAEPDAAGTVSDAQAVTATQKDSGSPSAGGGIER